MTPVLHPEAQRLQQDNAILLDELARLVAERRDLQEVVKPNLIALYQTKLGPWELRLLEAQCQVARLKRRTEMVQASLNRGGAPDLTEIDAALEAEFVTWQEQVKESARKIEEAQFRLSHTISADDDAELKTLYRALVKKLHPDVNPQATDGHRNLWQQVQAAYDRSDLEELRALALLGDRLAGVEVPPDNLTLLQKEHERLRDSLKSVLAALAAIKTEPPFSLAAQWEDDGWVSARREEIDKAVSALHEQAAALTKHLATLLTLNVPGTQFGPN